MLTFATRLIAKVCFFSERLSPESVRSACQKYQHEFRERIYSPAVTLWVFLAQVLSTDHSCREAIAKLNFWRLSRNLYPCNPDTGSYCDARQRLPEEVVSELVRATGCEIAAKADQAWHWLGRVIKVVDGSAVTMADTETNQKQYPQARTQAPGVGFPIARIVVVFSLAVGTVVDAAIGPYQGKRTGENNLFRSLLGCFQRGEVALADSFYASFWDFALLSKGQVDLVARAHHKRKIDFRRGVKLSFKGALQSLNTFLGTVIANSHHAHKLYAALVWMIGKHRAANRPDRIEPRRLKRRPKPHKLLQEPRQLARKRLLKRR